MSKMRRKTIALYSLVLMSFTLVSAFMSMQIVHSKTRTIPNSLKLNSLTMHDAIYIENDNNFTDYGFPGSGLSNDPYRIENYCIITSDAVGIDISAVSVYFIIQNCYIQSNVIGIEIRYCDEDIGIITNINSNGISITYTDSVDVSDNLFYSGGQAFINIDHSSNSIVYNNTLAPVSEYSSSIGIRAIDSDSITISNNNITRIRNGIYVDHCPSSLIFNNLLSDLSNYSYGNGIHIYSSDGTVIDNNICTECDDFGIYVYSFGSVTVQRNTLSLNEYGIHIKTSIASLVKENKCSQNQIGIYLESSDSTTIEKNSLTLNTMGIVTQSSDYITVIDNNCYLNQQIGLLIEYATSSLISRNNCSSNSIHGVALNSVSVSNITYNNISCNSDFGISFDSTSNCKIKYNLFKDNDNYAIHLNTLSSANIISHNSFIDNNLEGTSQCYDSGSVNLWYDLEKEEGNFWSNLGDNKTYTIDGTSGSIDKYPLNENLERTSTFFSISIFTLLMIVFLKVKSRRKKRK